MKNDSSWSYIITRVGSTTRHGNGIGLTKISSRPADFAWHIISSFEQRIQMASFKEAFMNYKRILDLINGTYRDMNEMSKDLNPDA